MARLAQFELKGRFPRGKRGLKFVINNYYPVPQMGRFPRGKRGLKYVLQSLFHILELSLPPREAWIEIRKAAAAFLKSANVASPAGSVD